MALRIKGLVFTYIVVNAIINFIINVQQFFSIYNGIWSMF